MAGRQLVRPFGRSGQFSLKQLMPAKVSLSKGLLVLAMALFVSTAIVGISKLAFVFVDWAARHGYVERSVTALRPSTPFLLPTVRHASPSAA